MSLTLVLLQSVAVVALGLVGILAVPKKVRWVVLVLSTLIFISSTAYLHVLNTRFQSQLINRIKILQMELLNRVMKSPLQSMPVSPRGEPSAQLQILKPTEGSTASWRQTVEGMVSNLQATVWVVVHPVSISAYWVQPPVTVRKDGCWRIQVYLGRAGEIDIGKQFEIMAMLDPKKELYEGQILNGWPDAKERSNIITVIRK